MTSGWQTRARRPTLSRPWYRSIDARRGFSERHATARFYSTEFPAIVATTASCERDVYPTTAPAEDTLDAGLITVSGTHPAFTIARDPSGHYAQYVDQTGIAASLEQH